MKKVNFSTRQFINDNIKLNTTASSYPLRKVANTIPTPKHKDNKADQAAATPSR
jgi:hypothetical protein